MALVHGTREADSPLVVVSSKTDSLTFCMNFLLLKASYPNVLVRWQRNGVN